MIHDRNNEIIDFNLANVQSDSSQSIQSDVYITSNIDTLVETLPLNRSENRVENVEFKQLQEPHLFISQSTLNYQLFCCFIYLSISNRKKTLAEYAKSSQVDAYLTAFHNDFKELNLENMYHFFNINCSFYIAHSDSKLEHLEFCEPTTGRYKAIILFKGNGLFLITSKMNNYFKFASWRGCYCYE